MMTNSTPRAFELADLLAPPAHDHTTSSISCGPIHSPPHHDVCSGWLEIPAGKITQRPEDIILCGCWCHMRRRNLIRTVIEDTHFDHIAYPPDPPNTAPTAYHGERREQ